MESNSFLIKNFRSFDENGVELLNLMKINLLIGKNNCWKSNDLKFIYCLSQALTAKKTFPYDLKNQHNRNGERATLKINISLKEMNFPAPNHTIHGQVSQVKFQDYFKEGI